MTFTGTSRRAGLGELLRKLLCPCGKITALRGAIRDGWLQNRNDIQSRSYEDADNAEVPGAE
jgi:hypothetical protein